MGYCNRCGEISTDGKCRKCGGRPVAALTAIPSPDGTVTDKWKSQYARSILPSPAPLESSQSTPLGKKPSFRHSLSVTMQKSCAHCAKRLQPQTPSFLEGESNYCGECHVKLYSKGLCHKCDKPVFPRRDAFIEHSNHIWHKDCFTCAHCQLDMSQDPMVDLAGRPCCEPCLMAQSGEYKRAKTPPQLSSPIASINSTPFLSPTSPRNFDTLSSAGSWVPRPTRNSRPSLESHILQAYQKSLRDRQPTPPLNENARTEDPFPTLPTTPFSPAQSIRSSTGSVSPFSGRSTPSPPTPGVGRTPTPPTNLPQKQPSPVTNLTQEPPVLTKQPNFCHICTQPLSAPFVKLILSSGDAWCHHQCLKCHSCKESFKESKVLSDGKHVYHPQCRPKNNVTPPTTPKTRYQCHACQRAISSRFLKNRSRYYHPECFKCFACHTVLPHDKPFVEVRNEPHCESCGQGRQFSTPAPAQAPAPAPVPTSTTSSPSPTPHRPPNHPSSLFMQRTRTRTLSRLGGSRICPRCQTSIAIMDDTLGPLASHWHKKCLQCAVCRKQMDSDAKVTESSQGRWLVHCCNCLVKRRKTRMMCRQRYIKTDF